MRLPRFLAFTQRSAFVRSIGVLVSGTVFAHGITALALPLLTRLYSPADFSVLAVFSSLLLTIAVAACLRFDIAVALPESDIDAVNILSLALLCASVVSILLFIPALAVPQQIAVKLNQPALEQYLWLLPVGVFLGAGYSAMQFWFVRKKQFGLIARSRVVQSASGAGLQIGLGVLARFGSLGLILGHIINFGMAFVILSYRFFCNDRPLLKEISRTRMRELYATYDRFPKYSTLEALANCAAIQVPIILIAAIAAGPEAGYLALALYVMQAPMSLIGTAVGQVYLSRAPDAHREGHLDTFTTQILAGLLKTGVGPVLFLGIVSPALFGIVFGEAWQRAGELVIWMTPWFIMQFLATPISMALQITGSQRAALALQVFGLFARVAAVLVASVWAQDWISEAYAISGFVFYFIYAGIILHIVSAKSKAVFHSIRAGLPYVACWILLGISTVGIIRFLQIKL
jgi:O-antigen/teichoic acid export membrane protein